MKNIDISEIRTYLKMSVNEMADKFGISNEQLIDIEKGKTNISFAHIPILCDLLGITLNELDTYELPKVKGIQIDDKWNDLKITKNNLVDYINKSIEIDEEFTPFIKELELCIKTSIVKPKIAFAGKSDAGKSTLINALLGLEKMPAKWTPTTSIVVHIKHIDDRPAYIDEEVCIFKDNVDGQGAWNDKKLDNKEYCEKYLIAKGNISLLSSFGIHQNENKNSVVAGSAVVFVDSDILKNCDLMDLPGFGTGSHVQDDDMTFKAKQEADILIYMSVANSFLHQQDLEYLRECLDHLKVVENKIENNLKPFANLYILASQAHTINGGNIEEIENILNTRCEAFYSIIQEESINRRSKISKFNYNKEDVRNRFFAFSTDKSYIREKFEKDLSNLLMELPKEVEKESKNKINKIKNNTINELKNKIEEFTNIIDQRKEYSQLLEQINSNEKSRINDTIKMREHIINCINEYNLKSKSAFSEQYTNFMQRDIIVEIMKKKKIKMKKDQIEEFVTFINGSIQEKLRSILERYSKSFSDDLDKFIKNFDNAIKLNLKNINSDKIKFSFNATKSFTSGLVGIATFGALSTWIVTTPTFLIASILGTTAGLSPILAVGGMFTIAIGIAVVAALGISSLLGSLWQKKVAKKIIESFEEQNYISNMNEEIDKYWNETIIGFNLAADSLENEWIKYIKELDKLVNEEDIETIKNKLNMAREIEVFFENIQL